MRVAAAVAAVVAAAVDSTLAAVVLDQGEEVAEAT